ncbi:rhamnolipids biosynthesis 3-oxoacyl-[acyl-carrier-protein] reductase [Abditibacteriota bacterium]|nr:rhamnolipids biosynthesis 3-oxoacyl-[acyl-carrier-protein] reductase [Abditibacteriota bacterium]
MKHALITGAYRGIGLEAARQIAKAGFHVWISARKVEEGEAAAQKLRDEGLEASFVALDVTDEASIQSAVQTVRAHSEVLDVLVNNAGVYPSGDGDISTLPASVLREALEANAIGPLLVTQAFWPLLQKSGSPRVVNVSSSAGRLYDMGAEMPAYGPSKTLLNAITRQFAGLDERVSVNSICPGWVRSEMGGQNAPRSVEEGANIITKLATMDSPPSGQFLNDAGEIGW